MNIEDLIKILRTPTGIFVNKECEQLADWLDDYQKCKAELEIYKKAFELLSEEYSYEIGYLMSVDQVMNEYLHKAREDIRQTFK